MPVFWSVCRLSQFLSITRIQKEGKIKRGTSVSLSDFLLSYNYTFFFVSLSVFVNYKKGTGVSLSDIFCHVIIHFFFVSLSVFVYYKNRVFSISF